MTALERHQDQKGEPLYVLAARLGIAPTTVYKMVGRNYHPRRDGEYSIAYPALRTVSDDTGIPVDTLFEEAQRAAQTRKEHTNGET